MSVPTVVNIPVSTHCDLSPAHAWLHSQISLNSRNYHRKEQNQKCADFVLSCRKGFDFNSLQSKGKKERWNNQQEWLVLSTEWPELHITYIGLYSERVWISYTPTLCIGTQQTPTNIQILSQNRSSYKWAQRICQHPPPTNEGSEEVEQENEFFIGEKRKKIKN